MPSRAEFLIEAFKAGEVTEAELARAILVMRPSLCFGWFVGLVRSRYPDARIEWYESLVAIRDLWPTYQELDRERHMLTEALFADLSDFHSTNSLHFRAHPITALDLGEGRFALLCGHHRVRRFVDLAGGNRLRITVLATDCRDVVQSYETLVARAAEVIGDHDVSSIPIY